MTANGRVAACQFEPTIGDVDRMGSILDSLESDVALAVFPELCVTGYALDVATERGGEVPGTLTDRLVDLAEALSVAEGIMQSFGPAP
ncbi:hypothetical protein [Haloarchaeobius sp. HRN-SO-5]|uniref:hypothetical protein n=1 Tax=Haloarchaeobius sp. HRN-SO-5 TaxID=3446118 RepID=UPI003EB85318